MAEPKVILIGGAPLIGKSSVARHLAARLAYCCLSTDDLGQAISAVTRKRSHPQFHFMDDYAYGDYFRSHSLDQLISHARNSHQALWPAVRTVITNHAAWGAPAIIEGWCLDPHRVAAIRSATVVSVWLVADCSILEARVNDAFDGCREHADEAAKSKFLARSLWHNDYIKEAAAACQLPTVEVHRAMTPTAVAQRVSAELCLCL